MPKIQEYPDITGLYNNNQFITERPNSQTGKISYENLWKSLWSNIVGTFEGEYNNITLTKDWTNHTLKIKGHTIDYWKANTDYMYGDLLLSRQENHYDALYMSYGHTSPDNWEQDRNNLLFISAPNYYYTFSFSPNEEWIEQNGYYTVTKACSAMFSSSASSVYNSFIIDYEYTAWNNSKIDLETGLKNYNYLEYATINQSDKTLTFYFSQIPTEIFSVKSKILYESYCPSECYIIKHPVRIIDNSSVNATDKTWSANKILDTLKIVCNINSTEVITLPEQGETNTIYKKLSDDNNQFIYGDYIDYTNYLWDNSKSKYSILGSDNNYLYFNLSSLPDISGVENVGYLIQKKAEGSEYTRYVWNSSTSAFEENNSLELGKVLVPPSVIATSLSLKQGSENTVYLTPEIDENESTIYNLSFWSTIKSAFINLGKTTSTENAIDLTNHIVVPLYRYNGCTGVEGVIYAYQYELHYWSAESNSFISIGLGVDYRFSLSYDKSGTLPETGNASKVYCIGNTTNTTLYDLYIWNTQAETPSYMIIGQVPKTSIK